MQPISLIFATGNPHKVSEVRHIAGPTLKILTPVDIGIADTDFPETSDTLQGNALQKALALFDLCKRDCFAEDTGLEVDALLGAPGVYTARYAGPDCTPRDNIEKLLKVLSGTESRSARFRTVIALLWKGDLHLFEGSVEGRIAEQEAGAQGFGYDPVFIPDGHDSTFAELSTDIKNSLSHRARAVRQMLAFLQQEAQK